MVGQQTACWYFLIWTTLVEILKDIQVAYPVRWSSRSTSLWPASEAQMVSSGSPSPWCCWGPAWGPSSARESSASRCISRSPPAPAEAAARSSRAGARWCQSDRGCSALGTPCEWACSSWRPHSHHLRSPARLPCWSPSQPWLPPHPPGPPPSSCWGPAQGQDRPAPAAAPGPWAACELGAVEPAGDHDLVEWERRAGWGVAPLHGGLPHPGVPSAESLLTGWRCLWWETRGRQRWESTKRAKRQDSTEVKDEWEMTQRERKLNSLTSEICLTQTMKQGITGGNPNTLIHASNLAHKQKKSLPSHLLSLLTSSLFGWAVYTWSPAHTWLLVDRVQIGGYHSLT